MDPPGDTHDKKERLLDSHFVGSDGNADSSRYLLQLVVAIQRSGLSQTLSAPSTPVYKTSRGSDIREQSSGRDFAPSGLEYFSLDKNNIPDFRRRSRVDTLKTRSKYYIPILTWLPCYKWSELPHDIIGGITIGIMLICQGLAYASLADLPAQYGLYCGMIPLLVYTCLGTSRHLSNGPEALSSILIGTAVRNYTDDGTVQEKIDYAMSLSLCIGLFMSILGIFRLGFLDSVMSRALLRGFILALALTIMVEQVPSLFKMTEDENASVLVKLWNYLSHLDSADGATVLVSFCSISSLFGIKWAKESHSFILKYLPPILFVVVVSILITYGCDLRGRYGIQVLGKVEAGFPPVIAPSLSLDRFSKLIGDAGFISIIAFVETIAGAKMYASKGNYSISSNRELVALGIMNIVGSFFGSYCSTGSVPRTGVSFSTGNKSQLFNMIAFTVVLMAALFLLPLFEELPKATMGSIVVFAASLMMEFEEVIFLWHLRAWKDGFLLLLTFVITLALGAQMGLVVSMGVSLVLVVQRVTLPDLKILGRGSDKFYDVRYVPQGQALEDILVIAINEPLFYANTGQLKELLRRYEHKGDLSIHPSEKTQHAPINYLILNTKRMTGIDASAMQNLFEIVEEFHHRGILTMFVKVRPDNYTLFERCGLVSMIGPQCFFDRTSQAIAYIRSLPSRNTNDEHLEPLFESSAAGVKDQASFRDADGNGRAPVGRGGSSGGSWQLPGHIGSSLTDDEEDDIHGGVSDGIAISFSFGSGRDSVIFRGPSPP